MSNPVEILRTDDVRGWPLAIVRGEERPRVAHDSLAAKLGVEPRAVIKTADSALGPDWKLITPSVEFRSGGRGPLARRWLFDRRQCLEIAVLSTGENARAIRGEMLDVFEAWLDGHLRPTANATVVDTMRLLGAKVGDNDLAERKLRAGLSKVAKRWRSTMATPIGRLRKQFGTPGYRSIPLLALDLALETLESWANDEAPPPPPPPDGPQLTLFKGGKAA